MTRQLSAMEFASFLAGKNENKDSILQENISLFLDEDILFDPEMNHFTPQINYDFPFQEFMFMDFILLQGHQNLIDYSILLSDRNPNFSFNFCLNLKRGSFW